MRDFVRIVLNVIDVLLLMFLSDEFLDKFIDLYVIKGIKGDIFDDNKYEFWK